MNSLTHTTVDTDIQMPCNPKCSTDTQISPDRREESRLLLQDEKFIHSCYRDTMQRAEFKNMNQLQARTQLCGHNMCIWMDVNLHTLTCKESLHTLLRSVTHTVSIE